MAFQQIILALDLLLNPITALPPYLALTLLSIMLTLTIFGLNKLFFRKNISNELKAKMEEIREKLATAQRLGNKEEIDKFFKEMMNLNKEFMKQNLKTLIISLSIISLIFPWLQFKYGTVGYIVKLPFELPILGSNLSWLYWYILISITIGWVINRLFS